jgi:IS30 family transposase
MPRSYEQLNRIEREYIGLRKGQQARIRQIGRELGRDGSTVSRELRRNRDGQGSYYSGQAQDRALERRRWARRPRKLKEGPVRRSVERGLGLYWSPEQISGRREIRSWSTVSKMTIYRHIGTYRETLGRYLRGPRRRRGNRRERIHDRTMIDERPGEVDRRERVGDWESDTIRGPMDSKACVATHVDRKSYYLVARLLDERTGEQMNRETVKGMQGLPVHTLTVDNGMEFGSFKKLEESLAAKIYFAHKKCPWERARNENTNRLLRQFFPRGTDFALLSPADVRRTQELLNNRPRKALGYRTPKEVMQQSTVALVK